MEEFDDEFGDLSGYKILSLDETTSFFKESKKPLQAIPNSSFEEISFEKKFGIENKCNEEKLGMFYHGQMRIDELISDLHKNSNNGKFFFQFWKLRSELRFWFKQRKSCHDKKIDASII